jgi:hypothetical protein
MSEAWKHPASVRGEIDGPPIKPAPSRSKRNRKRDAQT